MHVKKLLYFSVLILLGLSGHSQVIRYVKQGGTGNGATWATASGNLQTTINNSAFGDQVWVAAGTYQPAAGGSFSLKEGVKVFGGFPNAGSPILTDRNYTTNLTKLQGNSSTVIQNMATDTEPITAATELDGFTITGGNTVDLYGGGMFNLYSSPILRNLIISGNSAPEGGGIAIQHSAPVLINVLIKNNAATGPGAKGGGVHTIVAEATFINCTVTNNQSAADGGGIYAFISNGLTFYNCILWGNTAAAGTHPNMLNEQSQPDFSFSIIQDSHASYPYNYVANAWDFYFGYDQGWCLDTDPLFTTDGTYRLQAGSPARNAGHTALYDAVTGLDKDALGNPRIIDEVDMGYAEYQTPMPQVLYVKQGGTGDGSSWANAAGDVIAMVKKQVPGKEIWVTAGTYQPAEGESFIMKNGVKIYGGFAAAGNPGFADRDPEIYESILMGNGTRTVVNIHREEYPLTTDALLDGFTVTGGGNDYGGIENWYASPTLQNLKVKDNDGSGITTIHYSSPIINGCTISGNDAVQGSGIFSYNSAPVVTNTVIENNTGSEGTGVYVTQESTITLDRVTLRNNTSLSTGGAVNGTLNSTVNMSHSTVTGNDSGGDAIMLNNGSHANLFNVKITGNTNLDAAFYLFQSNAVLTNVLIADNTSTQAGGILCLNSTMDINNCTVANNSITLGGLHSGGGFSGAGPSVVHFNNSVFYGNTADYNENVSLYVEGFTDYAYTFNNCLIPTDDMSTNWQTYGDGIDNGGNIGGNPLFDTDYSPLAGSPAIDAGSNALYPTGAEQVDIRDIARIYNTTIDIGAFEYDPDYLGVKTVNKAQVVTLYPNPAKDVLNFSFMNNATPLTITIYSPEGKNIATYRGNTQVNVSGLARGMYIAQVVTNKGSYTAKFIKL